MSSKLLKEETVSKFMKLANISGDRRQHFITENFLAEEELEETDPAVEESYLEEDIPSLEEAEEAIEDEGEATEDEGEAADDEMGTVDVGADQVRAAIEAFDNLQPIIDSLRAAVEGEEPEPEAEEEPEPEPEAEEEPEPEPQAELPELPEEPATDETEERMYEGKKSQEELVNKIAKRVAARLLKDSNK